MIRLPKLNPNEIYVDDATLDFIYLMPTKADTIMVIREPYLHSEDTYLVGVMELKEAYKYVGAE